MKLVKLFFSSNKGLDLFSLAIFSTFLFFLYLGSHLLFVPDEGRYAEIAREMFVSKQFITPYLDDIKYFEKPPLFYWLTTFAYSLNGVTIWSARAVNALLAIASVLGIYIFCHKLYNRRTALFAALILSTNLLFFLMAHLIALDFPLTIFLSFSFFCFLLANQSTSLYLPFYSGIFAAFAVLTKGLIGIAFPMLIFGTWLALTGKWRATHWRSYAIFLITFFAVSLPWHILVQIKNPEFFHFYFIEQQFLRYTQTNIGHYQPNWFFLAWLPIAFFPWICFLPQTLYFSVKNAFLNHAHYFDNKKSYDLFFLLWFVIIFAFFSFSKSKLIPYILPAFPALAVLTARWFDYQLQKKEWQNIQWPLRILFIATIILFFSCLIFSAKLPLMPEHYFKVFLILSFTSLLAGIAMTAHFIKKKSDYFFPVLTSSIAGFLLFALAVFPAVDIRTIKPFADFLKPHLLPTDEVLTYHLYYQDLPFYLGRKIGIVEWQNELTFGLQHQSPKPNWLINEAEFWGKWHHNKRLYVLVEENNFADMKAQNPQEKIYILKKERDRYLISNLPVID